MLSIVKMDFDSDVEILENDIKTEVIDIDENSNEAVKHDLQQIPIVYTTRLDEMFVGRIFDPIGILPHEATVRIIKESKPVLGTYPGPPKKGRKNKKRFSELQDTLRRIYQPVDVEIKEEIEALNICNTQIDVNSVKREVENEPIVAANAGVIEGQVVKNEITKDTCKYAGLLKQCKPCRVLLPTLIGHGQVLHGGQLLKASKVPKPPSSLSMSSDDEVPLITFPPDLLLERNSNIKDIGVKEGKKVANPEKSVHQPKLVQINTLGRSKNKVIPVTDIGHRLLRKGLIEIEDAFSNDHHFYFTDAEGHLLDYFKNVKDRSEYERTNMHECKYRINNCCWVKKNEFIHSLYPKVLIYPNSRFIRKPHPCKPGACICCCRKSEICKKPDLDFTGEHPVHTIIQKKSGLDVVRDLEDEIDISIININRTPKLNSSEWLRFFLTAKKTNDVPTSLIGRALNYKKLPPVKQTDNRRLETLKKEEFLSSVIVFRNFAEDLTEIYEINEQGEIETYFKTACYTNTIKSDIQKLLRRKKLITGAICCWYKREEVIYKLHTSNAMHPRAIQFVRTNHTCQSLRCKCCCKPDIKVGIQLGNISLPKRSLLNSSTLNAWRKRAPASPREKEDDDCQITSVMSSPTLKLPQTTAIPAAAVPPSLFVTDVVDGDELSKEVNSLITSILDRFKDVRLTINGDGKVAAALNTPVNTLSTVELKVLANILSFAQSQVNVLGSKVGSGASLSLSNIINLKVDDMQSDTTIDPKTVYKEFGKNVNLTQKKPGQQTNENIAKSLNLPLTPIVPMPGNFFTELMSVKNQQFNDAFSSFINSKIDGNVATVTPVIENVFSLKETETENTKEESSSTTVWYRKPAAQDTTTKTTITTNTSIKRNTNSKPETGGPKKIRVRSPKKLGTVTKTSPAIMAATNIPQQQYQIQNIPPGLYVLPNLQQNFIVPSVTQPQMVNCMSPSTQQPMLIINPLQNSGGTLIPINTPNGHLQSNIPGILNNDSTSQLINTNDSNYITVEKDIPNQELTSKVTEGDPLNDPQMDAPETVCVLEDEGQISDNEADMDSDEEIELKYSPDNVEVEEDCILGV